MAWIGGGSVTVWHGLSDLGVWMRRELRLAPSAKSLQCSGMFYECVLSAWLCCGMGVVCTMDCVWVWMGPVHGGARACGVLALCAECEYEKGIGWMPWRQEAMKDVARCENLGGAASGL